MVQHFFRLYTIIIHKFHVILVEVIFVSLIYLVIRWLYVILLYCLEGFQMSIRLKGCVKRIYLVHDIRVFRSTITIRYGEPKQTDSWFHCHTHWWIHSVRFACKIDDNIFFSLYLYFFNLFFIWIYLTNNCFLFLDTN